jgi:hypothetical protein
MMTRWIPLAGVAAALVAVGTLPALGNEAVERYVFETPKQPESTVDGKGPLYLTLNRWSEDAERERVHKAVSESGPGAVLDALRDVAAIGYLRWPGGLEYAVRYARRVTRSDGTTDIVLLADRPLWVWWEGAGVTRSTDYPFTVIQVRMGKDGRGEGRSSLTTTVGADREAGIALSDFAKSAVVMNNVRREK